MAAKKKPAPLEAKPPAKNGRPSKLTPALTEQFVKFVKVGLTTRLACNAVGLHHSTFYDWMRIAKEDEAADVDSPERVFSDAIKRATAERAAFYLGKMAQGGANWQRWGWLLERTERDDYGRHERVEVAGDPAAPIGVTLYLPREDPEDRPALPEEDAE